MFFLVPSWFPFSHLVPAWFTMDLCRFKMLFNVLLLIANPKLAQSFKFSTQKNLLQHIFRQTSLHQRSRKLLMRMGMFCNCPCSSYHILLWGAKFIRAVNFGYKLKARFCALDCPYMDFNIICFVGCLYKILKSMSLWCILQFSLVYVKELCSLPHSYFQHATDPFPEKHELSIYLEGIRKKMHSITKHVSHWLYWCYICAIFSLHIFSYPSNNQIVLFPSYFLPDSETMIRTHNTGNMRLKLVTKWHKR